MKIAEAAALTVAINLLNEDQGKKTNVINLFALFIQNSSRWYAKNTVKESSHWLNEQTVNTDKGAEMSLSYSWASFAGALLVDGKLLHNQHRCVGFAGCPAEIHAVFFLSPNISVWWKSWLLSCFIIIRHWVYLILVGFKTMVSLPVSGKELVYGHPATWLFGINPCEPGWISCSKMVLMQEDFLQIQFMVNPTDGR